MDSDMEKITCSCFNCNVKYTLDYTSPGLQILPIQETKKYHQLFEAIMSSRLFCLECSLKATTLICRRAKIPMM